jgi:hypothetical protein
MSFITPLCVNRLVRGNGVEPRSKTSAFVELVALQVYLEKRCLEGILGHPGIAEVPPQVIKQLALVAADQRSEKFASALPAIRQQQLLIAQRAILDLNLLRVGLDAFHHCVRISEEKVRSCLSLYRCPPIERSGG